MAFLLNCSVNDGAQPIEALQVQRLSASCFDDFSVAAPPKSLN